jgi:hypothetical protein
MREYVFVRMRMRITVHVPNGLWLTGATDEPPRLFSSVIQMSLPSDATFANTSCPPAELKSPMSLYQWYAMKSKSSESRRSISNHA